MMFKVFRGFLFFVACLTLLGLGFHARAQNSYLLDTVLKPDDVFFVNQMVQIEGIEMIPFLVQTIVPDFGLDQLLQTAVPGVQLYTAEVLDLDGASSQELVNYWVVYKTRLFEPMPMLEADAQFADQPIALAAQVGDVIPFVVSLTDFFGTPAPWSNAVLSVLDPDTNEAIPVSENGLGIFTYDVDTQRYHFGLDTSVLAPGAYKLVIQFNSAFTQYWFTLELT